MVKKTQIWTGIRRQSGGAGGIAARLLSKKGTPTMGGILIVLAWTFPRCCGRNGTNCHPDAAFSGGAGGTGFLRRLRKNHQQSSGGERSICEAVGAGAWRSYRALSGGSFHQQADHGHHGSVLQVSGCDRRWFHRHRASRC